MKPTIGRIIILKLSDIQATEISRRRTTGGAIAARIGTGQWPLGAQAHIGISVEAGEEYPMIVVRVWSETCVNGQVLLDGNDTYWATSVSQGDQNGMWHWPERS